MFQELTPIISNIKAVSVDCCKCVAKIHIHAKNISGLQSLGHGPPVNKQYGASAFQDNYFGGQGMMHNTEQIFDWDQLSILVLKRGGFMRSVFLLVTFIALLLVGCSGSREPTSQSDLANAFLGEFGFPPSATVSALRCKIVKVGDTFVEWLIFHYTNDTIQNLVHSGFILAEPDVFQKPWGSVWSQDLVRQNPNAPRWWMKAPSKNGIKIYYKEGQKPGFASSYSYFWIDEETHTVYETSSAWN